MEREIVQKAIDGDDDAFLEMMQTYQTDLYKTALAFLKNKEEALEALQEVTFRAYRKRHQIKEPDYAKTWMVRVMIRYCQDTWKRWKRLDKNKSIEDTRVSLDQTDQIILEDAIANLSKQEQELIYLKYFHGVKIREMANLMNKPEGTVKTRLYTALAKLKHEWTGEEDGKDGKQRRTYAE